jgi:hypothetical protein
MINHWGTNDRMIGVDLEDDIDVDLEVDLEVELEVDLDKRHFPWSALPGRVNHNSHNNTRKPVRQK